jgi:uncharacterized protein YcbX
MRYDDPKVSEWFSTLLGIPCYLVYSPASDLAFQNESPLLLVSRLSFRQLQMGRGKQENEETLDLERLRANIVIEDSNSCSKKLAPFEEEEWVGTTIMMDKVSFKVS